MKIWSTRCALVTLAFVSLAALFATSYANARHPQPRCTHGESSIAVSIFGGHVKVIDPPTRTGC